MTTITVYADGMDVVTFSYDPTHELDVLTAQREARAEVEKQAHRGRKVETCTEDAEGNQTWA